MENACHNFVVFAPLLWSQNQGHQRKKTKRSDDPKILVHICEEIFVPFVQENICQSIALGNKKCIFSSTEENVCTCWTHTNCIIKNGWFSFKRGGTVFALSEALAQVVSWKCCCKWSVCVCVCASVCEDCTEGHCGKSGCRDKFWQGCILAHGAFLVFGKFFGCKALKNTEASFKSSQEQSLVHCPKDYHPQLDHKVVCCLQKKNDCFIPNFWGYFWLLWLKVGHLILQWANAPLLVFIVEK